jgi:methyl-accepting chemotaxis protein
MGEERPQPRPAMRTLTIFLLCILLAAPICAQKNKLDPLTQAQQDQIAEAGVAPVERLDLYVKFINEHADTIQGVIKRAHSAARAHRMDDELQNFTALMDELSSNLDVYADRKADIRKSMKPMNESIQRWQSILTGMAKEPGFEISLQDAIDSITDLAAQAKQVTADQDAYFKAHPDQKDQDRYEPK